MDAIYYNEDLSSIPNCINDIFDDTALMILEKIDEFHFKNFDKEEDFAKWEKGRIFNQKGEFKWKKLKNRIHGVYMGQDAPAGMTVDNSIDLSSQRTENYYLWGKLVKDNDMKHFAHYQGKTIYVELKIPFIFQYPLLHHSRRVVLEVKEYFDKMGKVQFTRYMGLAPR